MELMKSFLMVIDWTYLFTHEFQNIFMIKR